MNENIEEISIPLAANQETASRIYLALKTREMNPDMFLFSPADSSVIKDLEKTGPHFVAGDYIRQLPNDGSAISFACRYDNPALIIYNRGELEHKRNGIYLARGKNIKAIIKLRIPWDPSGILL